MLKFFKRIRKNLLKQGNLKSYLFYSIGEILLVMIGILLALQVNNWNEKRQEKKLEVKLLQGLMSDLNGSINDMSRTLRTDSIMITSGEQLIQILEDDTSTYRESMDQLFGWVEVWSPFEPRMMTYENLSSIGYSIISNETLQSNIIYLFDNVYATQRTGAATLISAYPKQLDMIFKHLRTGKDIVHKKPNDFEKIKKDEEYLNYLSYMVEARKTFVTYSKNTLEQMIKVKNQIDLELASRSKKK